MISQTSKARERDRGKRISLVVEAQRRRRRKRRRSRGEKMVERGGGCVEETGEERINAGLTK